MASSFAEAVDNLKFNKITDIESGGNQFDKTGKPLTSSAGAIGRAQVMPKTAPEAAKLAGVPFDESKYKNDADYNTLIGNAYFKEQVKNFGDESKGAAAYNAGPTAVRKAIEKYGENWLQGVPKETQDYVVKYNTPKEKTSSFADEAKDLIKPKSSFASEVESIKSSKSSFAQAVENSQPKTNWAGTGPEMSFGEYMKSGFAGRIASGLGSREEIGDQARKNVIAAGYTSQSDYNDKVGKEYDKLLGEWKVKKAEEEKAKGPEPTFKESLKGFGSELVNNPGRAVAGLIYELGKDPELLGLGAFAAPKAVGTVAAAGRTAKALQAVKGVGVAAAKGGALGAGLETTAEASESGNLDLQKITNTAGMFAVLGGGMKAAGEVYKGVKGTPKVKPDLTPEEFETELGKFESMSDTTKSSDVSTGLASDIEAGKTMSTDPIGDVSDTGLPIKQGPILDSSTSEPLFDSSNRPRMAIMRRDKVTGDPIGIELNLEEIGKRFEEKPWVKLGHPEDTFKTPEQYARFILKHEEEHVYQSFDEWKADRPVEIGEAELTEKELHREYETTINKRAKVKLDAEIDQELKDNPSLYELGDVFKDDTYTEQTGLNAVHRVIADISLNKRAAKIIKESIERMIPNKKIRERMTMAIEGEKETDRLLTDVQKQELLYGTGKVKPGTKFVDNGLVSALENMKRKFEQGAFKDEPSKLAFKEKLGKLEYVVNMLKELPSEENAIKLQKVIEGKFAEMGEIAKNEGVLDALRQNYVAHVIDFSDSVLSKENQKSLLDRLNLDPKESRLNRDFSEARMYRYIRDLEHRVYEVAKKMGLNTTGLKVQRDLARIYEVYQESMGNAIIQKRLTNFLANKVAIKIPVIGSDGQVKSVTNLGILTKDYKLGFENKYEQFTGYGSDALKGYMVHPDLIPALGHLFRQTDPNLVLRTASAISMLSKTITTMASMFHATSLAWARMGATPFGMLKEIGTGFSGTRAALETLRHDGHSKDVDNWARDNLKFETEDIQQGILPDVARNVDNFTTKLFTDKDVRLTRQIIDPLDTQVLQKINTFTWDFMHSAGKFATAQHIFANIKAKNPHLADQAIRQEVASFVNNTFGGLNWLKIADEVQNKTLKNLAITMTGLQGRTWMQVLMFAPDWTISTLRSYSKALPKETFRPDRWEVKKGAQGLINPTTSGDLARRYVLTTGVLYLTLINGINMAITGRPVWTNKDPTRIDLGDGTTMQLAKHSMEGPHWVLHPIKTAVNKLGYIPKTAVTLASPYVNTPMDALKVIGEPFVPFQISAAVKAPSGEKLKRGVFSFMGFPIYGQTDRQHTSVEVLADRKEQRKETRMKNKEEKLKRL